MGAVIASIAQPVDIKQVNLKNASKLQAFDKDLIRTIASNCTL